ncbi:hypothetical protein DYB26_002756 [Aphanomyces astaci]|uniref:Uncharacterized protein n=1 Tax=Aphanomyces astaci TaxID=112090 RepID=A0A3R6YC10_APHAT|nr:hypothetical protein DYB26_002756 [Aphanomyces astaci]
MTSSSSQARPRDDKQSRRMMAYREQKKKEMSGLEGTIRQLEHIRFVLHKSVPTRLARSLLLLPWHEVARSLADLRMLSESQNQALKAQLVEHEALVREMYHWTTTYHIKPFLDHNRASWRHASLLNDPATRKLGKEWITEHMFHNTDAIFHQYGFPPRDSFEHLLHDFNFTFDDNGYCVTARHMTRLSESVDSFLGHYQSTLLPFQTCILDYDVTSTTSFTKHHGVVPLDEDAAEYDIDLTSCPHHLTEARFPTLFIEAVLQNAQTGLSVRDTT